MAPFKEERGESPKVTRHTVGTYSTQLGDGGWLTTTIVHELSYLPPTRKPVRTLEQGDGRWGDRRQTQLPWFTFEDEEATPQAAPAPQQEAGLAWHDPDARGLYGSRSTDSTDSEARPAAEQHRSSNQESSDSLPRFRAALEALTRTSSQSSSTHSPTSVNSPEASPTQSKAHTASEESSAKSSLGSTKVATPERRRKSSQPQASSSSGRTSTQVRAPSSRSTRTSKTTARKT